MEGRVALVTGAAGGIGEAVVRELAGRGAVVAALDRDGERLGERTGKLVAEGLAVTAFPTDVTDSGEVEETVARIEDGLGPVDMLVNAAGVLRLGEVVSYDDADWRTTFDVNVHGVFHVSRAVVGRMVTRSRGAVVTVASNAAATPRADMAAYAASKAAAAMFTKSLGLEVARFGVRCNVVAPGSTDTPMLRSMWSDESGARRTLAGDPEKYRVGIPLGRIALPADVATAVAFLLSDAAEQITLHALTVDGGASLGA
ncbi:2,3-dihydro-2,3-dihydroxybenzoate dehydrogenase [Streptomyces fumanus]|uniref:2,3-dihydro-2,3-dihydroxybenzoate dehydrogenase n=1 Tax=Streptomyces fumanus TaxID=67302 RepID=A0A919AIR0_9ACTN|nr:2,3-dihydro-2,3-dihydroxybenzoate dehydrogenase [Streptomyces fumanus]GHF08368.1 2,3-dihydro-2,3-dihydroxybenzoate dehydrogenase [Streptomyces fumanus]